MPAPGEEARPDRERVGRLGRAAVHRALDPADDPAPRIGDEVAGGMAEINGESTHVFTIFPLGNEYPLLRVSTL